MRISQKAIDLIVEFEVSSKDYYEQKLQRPEWPGLQSGITVGIGYDLGYATTKKIKEDWGTLPTNKGKLEMNADMVKVMQSCAGITGPAAKAMLPKIRDKISITWDNAMRVFTTIDVPEWEDKVIKACPGAEKLHPDCLGALVSLAYNRGSGGFNASGDRNKEMRNIKDFIASEEYSKIPDEIRSMKRLWSLQGLLRRRDAEANLFQEGLNAPATNVADGTLLGFIMASGLAVWQWGQQHPKTVAICIASTALTYFVVRYLIKNRKVISNAS